jgi:hypothetical protein
MIAIAHLCDLLCRLRGLGYGYEEWRAIVLTADPPGWSSATAAAISPTIDLVQLTLDLDTYLVKVTALVDTIFSPA